MVGFQTTGDSRPSRIAAQTMERPKRRSLSLTVRLGKPVWRRSSETATAPPRITGALFA